MDERILHYAEQADEVWHAGDFGIGVAEALEKVKPLKGVYGNIDTSEITSRFPEYLFFEKENKKILMLHIGGYPGRYTALAKKLLDEYRPDIFISGHSHILKVMNDTSRNLLHLNPGACGKHGWHKDRTMLRFELHEGHIQNLEIIELGKR